MKQKILKMKWISVEEAVPIIPKGKYAIQIIGAIFDDVYERLHPGNGYDVFEVTYAYVTKKIKKESHGFFTHVKTNKKEFITLASGPKGSIWVPVFDPITHWMYLPEPPKYKHFNKKGNKNGRKSRT